MRTVVENFPFILSLLNFIWPRKRAGYTGTMFVDPRTPEDMWE